METRHRAMVIEEDGVRYAYVSSYVPGSIEHLMLGFLDGFPDIWDRVYDGDSEEEAEKSVEGLERHTQLLVDKYQKL